jgi:hypothetical protein
MRCGNGNGPLQEVQKVADRKQTGKGQKVCGSELIAALRVGGTVCRMYLTRRCNSSMLIDTCEHRNA